jgi:acyl-CoA synthetase (AMP-forming)/AMP-acid ligase II
LLAKARREVAPMHGTVAELLAARATDDRPGLRCADAAWTWREVVAECAARARWMAARSRTGPWHLGVLMDNTPELAFLLGGAALSGNVIVALNPTRLAADAARADCDVVVTEPRHADLARRAGLRVTAYEEVSSSPGITGPAGPETLLMLIFTSGTSGRPRAVRVTHRKIVRIAFGNEAAPLEQRGFGERFGCRVVDAYGSTESAIALSHDPAALPGVERLAVYGVPDVAAGDQVMVALVGGFAPDRFAEFLRGRTDLGAKWVPRYVRVTERLPATASNKVLGRRLAEEAWNTDDPVWWRPGREPVFRLMSPGDVARLHAEFDGRGRAHVRPGAGDE